MNKRAETNLLLILIIIIGIIFAVNYFNNQNKPKCSPSWGPYCAEGYYCHIDNAEYCEANHLVDCGSGHCEKINNTCETGAYFNGEFCQVYETLNQSICESSGGLWNGCGSKCQIDNPGSMCPAVCQSICECGGKMGMTCPKGYICKTPGCCDRIGYCEKIVYTI